MNGKALYWIVTTPICFALIFGWGAIFTKGTALAEGNELNNFSRNVYTDQLAPGWRDFSWGTVDLNNPSPVHSGTSSIKANLEGYTGIYVYYPGIYPDGFTSVSFYINGGDSGGQLLDLYLKFFDGANYVEGPKFRITAPVANTWVEVNVPLSSLGVSNLPITSIIIQNQSADTAPTFYVDDITLIASTDPAAPTVSSSVVNPRAVIADNQTKVSVTAQISDPQGTGDISEIYIDGTPFGRGKIQLEDNGLYFDGNPNDGQYGAVFTVPANTRVGEYLVALHAIDNAGHHTIVQTGTLVVMAKPDISLPSGIPARLGWGSNAWVGSAGTDWQGASGVPWDYNYTVVTYDWYTSGLPANYIPDFVSQAWNRGEVPVIVIYMMLGLSGCGENGSCYASTLQDEAKVSTYLAALTKAVTEADGTQPVIFIIEPDFIGFMQQFTNEQQPPSDNPHEVPVALNQSGYENTLAGFGQYIVNLIHTGASNILAAPMVSWWGAGDDPFVTVSQNVINNAQRAATFTLAMGGQDADFLAVDWDDRDAGSGETEFWDPNNYELPRADRANLWENTLSATSNKPLLLWRVPAGNMNLNNTPQHYQDNRAEYVFSHSRDLIDSGVIGVLFGGGTIDMTQVWTDGDFIKDQAAIAYAVPSVPTGLSVVQPGDFSVLLRWEPNSEPDIWGYSIEYTPAGGGNPVVVDAGRANSASLLIQQAGDYTARLRVYDAMGNFSDYSGSVSFTTTMDAPHVYMPLVISQSP